MWIACLLADAQRGTVTGSPPTLSTETLQQTWSLDQLGNWSNVKLDLTNDGDWADAGEYDDNRTHNVVNELTNRDLDGSGGSGPNYALTYGGNGELATDGHEYEYSWDAWGRLVSVYSIIADAVVSDFEYNGLGWQKSFTEAVAGGGTVTFWNTHDHQGRTLQTRRGTDASGGGSPYYKLRYVYHNAGHAGSGSSSYRNAIVLRDADMTNGWTGSSDGTLEARHYYCQNYRGDVVALVTAAGKLAEQVRYDAYGYPTCLPTGDTDSDGDWDATDSANITGAYDIRKDVNLDGTISSADVTDANTINGTTVTLGRGVLSNDSKHHNRLGWQGSEHASTTPARLVHTPARHHHVVLGRWISRDPAGYVDGPSLYAFVRCFATRAVDYGGLKCLDPTSMPCFGPGCIDNPVTSTGCAGPVNPDPGGPTIYYPNPGSGLWDFQIVCHPIGPNVHPGQPQHCFLLARDANGNKYGCRGGTSLAMGNLGRCDGCVPTRGCLVGECDAYKPGFPDYRSPPDTRQSYPIFPGTSYSYSNYQCVRETMEKLSACCLMYELPDAFDPLGRPNPRNSNGILHAALKKCFPPGSVDPPRWNNINAPGWNSADGILFECLAEE